MKIMHKLLLGFVGIALLTVVVGDISLDISKKALRDAIGQRTVDLAVERMDKIDRHIFIIIKQLNMYTKDLASKDPLLQSNDECKKTDHLQFCTELIHCDLSEELREKMRLQEFATKEFGQGLFKEAFLTNKYGMNIAQTGKTSDTDQADERWWQETKEEGLWVRQVEEDESAGLPCIAISTRVDDNEGNFLGILNAVLDIQQLLDLVRDTEAESNSDPMQFMLITENGTILSSPKQSRYIVSQKMKKEFLSYFTKGKLYEQADFFVSKKGQFGAEKKIFAHAHSKGYNDFKGLGWTFVIEGDTKKLFAPIQELKKRTLDYSASATLLAVLVGIFVARSICQPTLKLCDAAEKIGKGMLEVPIEIQTNDEIGQLGRALQKMASDLRINQEKLDAANQAKNEFFSMMSHELRTPLHGILSFSRFGIDKHATAKREKMLNYFERIQKCGNTLHALLDNLLDLSKFEAGKMLFELKPTDISLIVSAMVEEFKSLCAERNLSIRQSNTVSAERVFIDAEKIKQVVRNLLSNATKFSPEGGIIELDMVRKGSTVTVSVKDEGPGIPENELETVFDRFIQSSKTKTRAGGTGLGLAICKEIVAGHNGRIWAQNRPEGGAVFIVEIPIVTDTAIAPEAVLIGEGNE